MDSYFDGILQTPGLNHLTINIFKLLDIKSLDNCLVVSKKWHHFIKENGPIWKQHFSIEDSDLPLHNACTLGHVNMVKLLIKLGFDVNEISKSGETLLFHAYACIQNKFKVVELLCQQPRIDVNNDKNQIFEAHIRNHMEIFKILLNHPIIDVNATIPRFSKFGNLLHIACAEGNSKVVEMLCQHPNINVNAKSEFGKTPLFNTCLGKGYETILLHDFLKVIETLCKHPNIDVNAMDNNGYTALHYACKGGKLNAVKLLLKQPCINIKILNNSGQTPMDLAKSTGHQSIVEYFSSLESNVTIPLNSQNGDQGPSTKKPKYL